MEQQNQTNVENPQTNSSLAIEDVLAGLTDDTVNQSIMAEEFEPSIPDELLEPQYTEAHWEHEASIPDSIMRDVSTKEVLKEWTEKTMDKLKTALVEYYASNSFLFTDLNKRCKPLLTSEFRKKCVEYLFEETRNYLLCIIPLFNSLINEEFSDVKEFYILVYGIGSDEVYMVREFARLYKDMYDWETFGMWNNCVYDERLAKILHLTPKH